MEGTSPLVHAKHVLRAALLLILFLVGLVLGRSAFVPPSWGEYGSFRASAVPELAGKRLLHGGRDSCASCHAEQHEALVESGHASVSCELCHAPLATHVRDGQKTADMSVRRSAALCVGCHQELRARPESFPQIQPAEHLRENGGEPGPEACFDCHDPHEPL